MYAVLLPAPLQDWGAELFEALKQCGGKAYSNYAVGYDNVKVDEATKRGIPVGNTPGETYNSSNATTQGQYGQPAALSLPREHISTVNLMLTLA